MGTSLNLDPGLRLVADCPICGHEGIRIRMNGLNQRMVLPHKERRVRRDMATKVTVKAVVYTSTDWCAGSQEVLGIYDCYVLDSNGERVSMLESYVAALI